MWFPITLEALDELINTSEAVMDAMEQRLWKLVRISPAKWRQEPWGNEGGGFWVVAIFGEQVIWYNDIEDGFNTSRYSVHGTIDEYWCNQDELHHVVYSLRQEIESGVVHGKLGPPMPLDDVSYNEPN